MSHRRPFNGATDVQSASWSSAAHGAAQTEKEEELLDGLADFLMGSGNADEFPATSYGNHDHYEEHPEEQHWGGPLPTQQQPPAVGKKLVHV